MMMPSTSDGSFGCATWCQPPDVYAEDLIVLDDEVIDVTEDAVRTAVVEKINAVANLGTRMSTPYGGWKIFSPRATVMEIPVVSGHEKLTSSVTVLVNNMSEFPLDRVIEQVTKTAALAGYSTSPSVVRGIVEYQIALTRNPLARIWKWIRRLLSGRGRG